MKNPQEIRVGLFGNTWKIFNLLEESTKKFLKESLKTVSGCVHNRFSEIVAEGSSTRKFERFSNGI